MSMQPSGRVSPDKARADREEPPAILAELSPEQFNLWRRHPVSALLLERYLPDFRAALERNALNAWLGGNLSLNAEQEARGYILTTHLLENLHVEQIREFYGLQPWEDQQ